MTPTLANLERARCQLRPDAGGELRGDVEDIAAALDAAELRGHTRAVESTAIASIHKAVAAERAACVAFLRRPCEDTNHHPSWCPTCETRLDDAHTIEAGDHHKEQA